MAGSSAELSSTERGYVTNGKPMLVASNAITTTGGAPIWNNGTSGTFAEDDRTESQFPGYYACDGQIDVVTYPIAEAEPYLTGGDGVWRLLARLDTAKDIDVAIVAGLNLAALTGTFVVSIQLSDTSDFAATVEIASWTTTSSQRLVDVELYHTGSVARRYSGYAYARLIIRRSGSTSFFRPSVGELVLGRRRQLTHKPRIGPGYDDRRLFSRGTRVETRTGSRTTYEDFRGRRELSATFLVDDTTERDDIRTWFEEASYGHGHWAWIEDPSSSPANTTYWMDLEEESRLDFPLEGPTHRGWTLGAVELPRFLSAET